MYWITSYKLQVSTDDINWTDVEDGKVFSANSDSETIVSNFLAEPV